MKASGTGSFEWKYPKKEEMEPGVRARVQHVHSIAGPKPEITWIEGFLSKRGKKQIVFTAENGSLEFDIATTTQIQIARQPKAK